MPWRKRLILKASGCSEPLTGRAWPCAGEDSQETQGKLGESTELTGDNEVRETDFPIRTCGKDPENSERRILKNKEMAEQSDGKAGKPGGWKTTDLL